MSDYAYTLRKQRRLVILEFLHRSAQYCANGEIIKEVLNSRGIGSTADQVTTELVWLRDQGMIDLDDLGGILLATATVSGIEMAIGIATHPDIQRPSPTRHLRG